MRKVTGFLFTLVSVLLLSLGVAGCGKAKPDFFVLVENANGVAPQSKVMWRGVEVGTVTEVKPDAGKIRLDVILSPEYKGQIRDGVRAKPMKDFSGLAAPILNLFGGSEATAPVVPQGSQVPEATLLETLQYTNFWDWFAAVGYGKWSAIGCLVVVVLALIAWKILKGLGRLVVLAAAILLVVGSFWVLRQQWDKYKSSLVSPEVQQQVDDILDFTFQSPEANEAWTSIKTDMSAILTDAKKHGSIAVDSAKAKIEAEISRKAGELRDQGKEAAAVELERINNTVLSF